MEKEKSKIAVPPELLQQLRNLSIPLWIRIGVISLVSIVFIGNICFFVYSFLTHQEKWLEASVTILGTTFLPTIIVVSVAFAETGTKALASKTKELLTEVIPTSIQQIPVGEYPSEAATGSRLKVTLLGEQKEGPTCRYRVDVISTAGLTDVVVGHLLFSVDINVSKVNVSLLFPAERLAQSLDKALVHVQGALAHTLEGAKCEDYTFNSHLVPLKVGGFNYFALVLIKRMAEDFLWDPAKQLYFAQDLGFFIGSALTEGRQLFGHTG